MLNETDFFNMMERRRKDLFFSTVTFIRNYMPVKDNLSSTILIKFSSDEIEFPELMSRARTNMRVYATNIAKDEKEYISDEQ